MSPLCHHAFST